MGEMVSYAGDGRGYLARPTTGGPVVVLISEQWTLAGHITTVADRFAAAGFVALVPDLGEDDRLTAAGDDVDKAATLIADAAAYASEVAGDGDRSAPVATVGFGTGGSLALWSAARSDAIVAAVAFYPSQPLRDATADWSGYAGKSSMIHRGGGGGTADHPDLPRAITTAGGTCTTHEYPDAGGAFFNDDRAAYHAGAAATAWARTLAFLRSTLA
jgi:carboxymethylenebutenolidase